MAMQPLSATHRVIEALYDLPLAGDWQEVQAALCRYWSEAGDSPSRQDIDLLERHFTRALAFLERLPAQEHRWRHDLYRLPVPACIFNLKGELLDANPQGQHQLGCGADHALPSSVIRQVAKHIAGLEESAPGLSSLLIGNGDGRRLCIYFNRLIGESGDSNLYLGVVVTDDLPSAGMALLAEQAGLTEREADLCLQLASGKTLDQAAEEVGVKKTTMRTHLANSFAKLGVNSQPELVALVWHHLFAGAQLSAQADGPPTLTPYLDPELHGYPKYSRYTLPDGRTLGYFEYGDPGGIPVLLLHGSIDCGLIMKSQRLTGYGVRLIAAERGGVGESSPNPDPSPQAYADDLMALIDHLGLATFAVIGRSMGSWDAITLAQAAGPRCRLLTLVSGRLPLEHVAQHAEEPPFYRSLFRGIWESNTIGRVMLKALFIQLLVKGPKAFMPEDGLPQLELDLVRDENYQRHMKAMWMRSAEHGTEPVQAHLKLYRDPVPDPPWKNLTVPTLLIHGERDDVVPVDKIVSQTDSFTNRELIIMPDVGHRLIHLALGEVLGKIAERWHDV